VCGPVPGPGADSRRLIHKPANPSRRRKWAEQVKANGITEAELRATLTRMAEDRMSTLSRQLEALRGIGFQDVNCWYKNYSFAVYSGRR
jgi:tRNA (cmo5U34)-methyltransferase